jgi:hypothetical protein
MRHLCTGAKRLGCVVAALAVLAAAPALAQPTDAANAKRLAYQGRKALRAANYPEALKQLTRAFELEADAGVAYDLALCHRALNQYGDAIALLRKHMDLRGAKLKPWERTRVRALIAELERKQCQLTLDVEPAGAIITVDDQRAGTAPLAGPLTVSPGRHVIDVAQDGYGTVTQTVEVAGGQTLVVSVKLERRVLTGMVTLNSAAPGATAVIGRGTMQPLPLTVRLAEGEHVIKVVAPNHHPHERTITVAAGDMLRVEVSLAPIPEPPRVPEVKPAPRPVDEPTPVYKRAWFWVTIGAVAVAGAATGGYFGYRSVHADSFDRSVRLR